MRLYLSRAVRLARCLSLFLLAFIATADSRSLKPGTSKVELPAELELRESKHVLRLERTPGRTHSSHFLHSLVRQGPNTVVTGTSGDAPLFLDTEQYSYNVPVHVGNETFLLFIDTGGPDLYLFGEGYTCVNGKNETLPPSRCNSKQAPPYQISPTFNKIPHENLHIVYAGGSGVQGIVGFETITVANITVAQQEIGVAYHGFPNTHTKSSGALGLSYRAMTEAYLGSDPSKDNFTENVAHYNPLFTTMWKKGLVKPLFSIALQRASNSTVDSSGDGVLAIGGLPPGYKQKLSNFVSTDIIKASIGPFSDKHFTFYTIHIDGYVFAPATNAKERTQHSHLIKPSRLSSSIERAPYLPDSSNISTFVPSRSPHIVDTGTTLVYVPKRVARAVNAMFKPPATFRRGEWTVQCNATAPHFGIIISNQTFYINPLDMISPGIRHYPCASAVQASFDPGLYILGEQFLKNVLAVFDIGASKMRFASRESD